ncbi:MAG: HD domain-containing protein [Lachnospiraceae bacterium]|nr:HD domain-containing protein [Lachnospiraceae bacterium]
MLKYEILSPSLSQQIAEETRNGTYTKVGFDHADVIRRKMVATDQASVWRPPFVHDIDKIMHCPYYNRYADKTQVFSLIKNDDVTRRSLHVQLVSRIARTIGSALHLNLDLIEAIALGHDMGHTPFGHAGESYLDELFYHHAGLHFSHNIHSVRVLDGIYPYNISLQTLNGIASHNGEVELEFCQPEPQTSFEEFDAMIRRCYEDKSYANKILPSTLEGCVVRVSDIISYLGKDRQDAARVNVVEEEAFTNEAIGSFNAEIINNLVVNIIENSYGKPYIKLDHRHFEALRASKKDNYAKIYANAVPLSKLNITVKPMMGDLYGQLLDDLKQQRKGSPIYRHHINYVNRCHYKRSVPYESADPNQIVVDYIASMTDDYFIDLHQYLFPNSQYKVEYRGYFADDASSRGHQEK